MSDQIPEEQIPQAEPGPEQPEAERPQTVTEGAAYTTQTPPPVMGSQPLTPSEERTWAALAHLSILVNLFSGFLGPLAALVIYFIFRERSRYVAYQAFQSFLFQMVFWVGAGLLIGVTWTVTAVLLVVLIGFCLIPIAIVISLIPVVALGYGIVGAIRTGQGEDFEYWLVGSWTRDILRS
jgi:uncharacterized Tic20 family protein